MQGAQTETQEILREDKAKDFYHQHDQAQAQLARKAGESSSLETPKSCLDLFLGNQAPGSPCLNRGFGQDSRGSFQPLPFCDSSKGSKEAF